MSELPETDATPTPADAVAAAVTLPFAARWWTYQRERFPLFAHGVLIAAFSFCAVALSRILRGEGGWPHASQLLVAFGTCFSFFLQLRIADEFKDYEEDLRHRPYRPVQRGLVSLRQLGIVFILAAIAQLALALWLNARLVPLLLITWLYLAAMSKEFFIADWLRGRHVLYMASHMVIMPLVDLYATSTDWLLAQPRPPAGLLAFLLASYCNGLVIEIGRKIRSPEDEEAGVATYSHVWGRRGAVVAWLGALAATAIFAMFVAVRIGHVIAVAIPLGLALIGAVMTATLFLQRPHAGRGKWIETYAGVWTIVLYLTLGLLPHLLGASR